MTIIIMRNLNQSRAGNYYETIHTFICPWPSTFGETYILVNLIIILFFAAMHGVFCADSYLQLYNSSSQKLFYRTMHASLELTSFWKLRNKSSVVGRPLLQICRDTSYFYTASCIQYYSLTYHLLFIILTDNYFLYNFRVAIYWTQCRYPI